MTALTITRIDPYRVDAHIDGKLVAYAIADRWGWALMARRDGRIATVQRVDYGPTARRAARVGTRLVDVVLGRQGNR